MYNLIDRRECSRLLGVSYNQIPNLCRFHELEHIRIGGKWLFDKEKVTQFIKQNTINYRKPEVIN